jgi:hypothetical protein
MAATRTRSSASTDGNAAAGPVTKVRQAGDTVTQAAGRAKGPLVVAGTTAAALAGGLVLGSQLGSKRRGVLPLRRRKILGLPVGRKSGLEQLAEALGQVANGLGSATQKVSSTTDDVHQIREQLERTNKQSPIEVLLDGLTHRRGAHKQES